MNPTQTVPEGYLVPPRQAHRVLVLLFMLMMFDFIDRQVVSAVLPLIKADWGLSDTQLGTLISIVNVSIALLALPTAIIVDRWSRAKSIGIMATVWSLGMGACALSGTYLHLLVARFFVGAGEAGYQAGGNALLSAMYPKRMRATVIGIFQSAAIIGSVIGVLVGGVVGSRWGWRHAFGSVAVPGLLLAVLMFWVKDYASVKVEEVDATTGARHELGILAVLGRIFRSPVLLVVFVAQASQLFFVATVSNWLPTYFTRFGGMTLKQASIRTAMVFLASALGVALCGYLVDRAASGQAHRRLYGAAMLSLLTALSFGLALRANQPLLIFVGAFFMASVLGPVMSAVIDFVHPGMRSSTQGVMVTSSNLLGMSLGPLIAGMLADRYDLRTALSTIALVPLLATVGYLLAGLLYRRRGGGDREEPALRTA